MEIKKLLPIGSIVRLKSGTKRLMVIGVMQTEEGTGDEYDYLGVIYPEGNLGEEGRFLFDHKNIDEVVFRGFEDEERDQFIINLDNFYANRGKSQEA